ncbi:MAG TPA: HD family hydrolase [Kofleriaceae bacterium]|nr:HD family hydrolase [Kofleriaceae bacterium]
MDCDRLLDQLDALAPLGDLPRTGWVLRGCLPAETIAAHTVQVAILVAALCDALRAEGTAVDGERALRMALVHDAPEARTGDMPMPMKTDALARELVALETRIIDDLLPPALRTDWADAEHRGSVEADLVAAADKIQMLAQALRYERRGVAPQAFVTMWANPANLRAMHLAPIRALYASLFARAGRAMPA